MADITVEVVYALPERAFRLQVHVPAGASVGEALNRSRFAELYPQFPIDPESLAIFGRPVQLSDPLKDKDRIEILRPLLIDPKEARRLRAAKQD